MMRSMVSVLVIAFVLLYDLLPMTADLSHVPSWMKDGRVSETPGSQLGPRQCYAQDWRAEFDDICGKTSEAMTLSKEELKKLIERCDKLKTVIGTLEETERKVFLKRLQLCRDLFAFVLESKEKQ